MQAPATLAGIDHGGILVNAEADDALPTIAGNTVVRIAASRLAEETIGRRVPNVALLAALIRLTDLLPLAALQTAIDERFEGAIATKNKLAAEKAYGLVEAGAWRGLVGQGGDHADRH
jgi:pyruvate ferredoxin oxidoreductase gamma subunit